MFCLGVQKWQKDNKRGREFVRGWLEFLGQLDRTGSEIVGRF